MTEKLVAINSAVNSLVWGGPMLIALVGAGIYLSFRTGFIQFTKSRLVFRETIGKMLRQGKTAEGDVTPFQALTVAMGGTVGVGNIAGVATAIAAGGPGAVFWMLVSGLVGMATKYAEVLLGLHYRKREPGQPMMGGPMMYITRGLGPRWRWLAVVFCIFGALAGLGIGNMTQAQAVAAGMEQTFGVTPLITGIVMLALVGMVTVGGIKRIAHVAMVCVPFMCGLYIIAAVVIIGAHITRVPAVLAMIVKYAFTPYSVMGGAAGIMVKTALKKGIARGVFSNEAGLGSAPMAHATAMTDHPAKQGLWGIFEVFCDTIIMCTMTALVILLTGAHETGLNGAQLTMNAFGRFFGRRAGDVIVTFSMILTAYSTNIAWCFYGETCTTFILGHGKAVRRAYRLIWLPFILIGALGKLDVIWSMADTLNGLMALPNLIALVALAGVVVKLTKGYLNKEPYSPAD